jgi:2-succinyl-5-enolpyruvyl-6-hydroxy-3-cyclohexene-1-carboxylate synthase
MTNFQRAYAVLKVLSKAGMRHLVLSPGSRNAPLMIALKHFPEIHVHLQPDERSAAYIAMGLSSISGAPAACCCTSGTAAANFLPAVIESHYMQIPLVCITADRPLESVDMRTGQTIRQRGLFGDYALQYFNECDEAVDTAALLYHLQKNTPLQINLAFAEPLYLEDALPDVKLDDLTFEKNVPPISDEVIALLNRAKKPLLIIGQMEVNEQMQTELTNWISAGFDLIGEPLSNINGIVHHYDLWLKNHEVEHDLVISMGRDWVSKRIKGAFNVPIIHIEEIEICPEPFGKLTHHIKANPLDMLPLLREKIPVPREKSPLQEWNRETQEYLNTVRATWSDFSAIRSVVQSIPQGSILHCGNSSTVRYAMLFAREDLQWYANRGTAGIDGSVSTAIGQALGTDKEVVCLVGDLSFFYDSNALWQKPNNLSIVVINNGRGHIFQLIKGPETTPQIADWQQSAHDIDFSKLAAAFGWEYELVKNEEGIHALWPKKSTRARIIEVYTAEADNAAIFQKLLKF